MMLSIRKKIQMLEDLLDKDLHTDSNDVDEWDTGFIKNAAAQKTDTSFLTETQRHIIDRLHEKYFV